MATDSKKTRTPSAVGRADNQDETEVKKLIGEIKAGNQQAFTELVHRYRSQVTALAFKMVSDYDEASDIAQSVFMKVSKNIWRYDENRKFYTWLHRITANAAIDHIRKLKRHRHEQLEDYHDVKESPLISPEINFRRHQLGDYIQQATLSLNEKQRSAFMLRDVQGCKIDAVADMMDIPEATVRWYLHRARTRIRRELTRKCPQLLFLLGIR